MLPCNAASVSPLTHMCYMCVYPFVALARVLAGAAAQTHRLVIPRRALAHRQSSHHHGSRRVSSHKLGDLWASAPSLQADPMPTYAPSHDPTEL